MTSKKTPACDRVRRFVLSSACAALALAGTALTAQAADGGQMIIKNDSNSYVTYYVPADDYWNCDDAPTPGFVIASVAPGVQTSPFTFVRKDGHGCNGGQGQFSIVPTLPNVAAAGQHFWYDSHGSMELQPPQVNYLSRLEKRPDGIYVWTVTPSGK